MVQTLRQIWVQQFYATEGSVQWRTEEDLAPSAMLIHSPYDGDALLTHKTGYFMGRVEGSVTETCDEETPHLITHVETTPATTYDGAVMETIHAALEEKGLRHVEHVVDSGYLDAEVRVRSQQAHAITLIGPVAADNRGPRQSRARICDHAFHD
jgi:transposase